MKSSMWARQFIAGMVGTIDPQVGELVMRFMDGGIELRHHGDELQELAAMGWKSR